MCLSAPPTLEARYEEARPDIESALVLLTQCCTARDVPDATAVIDFDTVGFPNGIPERCGILTVVLENGSVYWSFDQAANWTLIFEGSAPPTSFPIGSISAFAGAIGDIPANWLPCDGDEISRSTYANLFAIIGETYGVGDGLTTFNLPNLRGRVPQGANYAQLPNGTNGTYTTRARGVSVGEENHTLLLAELPSHTHTSHSQTNANHNAAGGATDFGTGTNANSGTNGTDTPHNNMQPFVVDYYIIKT